MLIKQLSIFIENKPGRLCEISKILGDNNIDIRALSIADTTNFGILRLIVNNPQSAEKILKGAGFTVSLTKVIAIGISDKPGGLSQAMNIMLKNDITVEYMYAFVSREKNDAYVIVRVNDNDKAVDILEKNNIKILTCKELYDI